jgi:tetratricopeptide (TPR) repeat protein
MIIADRVTTGIAMATATTLTVDEMFSDALRLKQAGRLGEAESLLRHIAAVDARHADSLHLLGVISCQAGRYDTAVSIFADAIAINGESATYHCSLAGALQSRGRLDDAVAAYGRALSLKPDYPEAHNNLANALLTLGKPNDAAVQCERALELRPDYPEAHNNLANALQALGKPDEAVAHYERALELRPDYPEAHNNLANALQTQGKLDEAAVHCERALELKPGYAEAHNNWGNVLQAQDRLDDAVEHYERALALKPDDAFAYNNLGNALRAQGKLDEALAKYDRALALDPIFVGAHNNRANIKSFRPGDPEFAVLEGLARADAVSPDKAPYLHFALAKALEDAGDYPRAFEHLLKGNALKRQQIDYDRRSIQDFFRQVARVFDQGLLARLGGLGDPSATPIFVIGMPRSGSTLIEQILASHPQIHGGGELKDLHRVTGAILFSGHLIPYPDYVAALNERSARRLGQAYLAQLPALPEGKVRLVDKLPGNLTKAGLISLILPNARIIHSMRDPADTCVSCFATLFSDGQNFSYDLAELGHYYRCYHELMEHWRSVLPSGVMLDVSYENVVDDLEGQARQLIAHCGLAWSDRCLSFHKTNRPVANASGVQVRQPLFRKSLKRWRRFESYLQPLLTELGALHSPGWRS